MTGQTILSCDFTYHLKRCHYDAKLLDNATLANSWSQVEIQWHSGSLFQGRVSAMHLRTEERREEFLILHDQWQDKAKVPLDLYENEWPNYPLVRFYLSFEALPLWS